MTKLKPTALATALAVLFLLRITLSYSGQAATALQATELGLILTGLAHLVGAMLLIVFILLAVTYAAKAWGWFQTQTEPTQPDQPESEARLITKDLAQTVVDLQRYGDKSGHLVRDAQAQTAALVQVAKKLQGEAITQGQTATSLNQALEAIASQEPLKISQAAGQVMDAHIRDLMLISSSQATDHYWQNVSQLIAVQQGNAHRWQTEYSNLAANIIAEISGIKTRLTAAKAHIIASEAAQPLLVARNNLDQTAHILRAPLTDRLEAPAQPALSIGA